MIRLIDTAKKFDIKINVKKIKAVIVNRDDRWLFDIVIDGLPVEQVANLSI